MTLRVDLIGLKLSGIRVDEGYSHLEVRRSSLWREVRGRKVARSQRERLRSCARGFSVLVFFSILEIQVSNSTGHLIFNSTVKY